MSENVALVDKATAKAERLFFKNTATNLQLVASADLISNSIRAGVKLTDLLGLYRKNSE